MTTKYLSQFLVVTRDATVERMETGPLTAICTFIYLTIPQRIRTEATCRELYYYTTRRVQPAVNITFFPRRP